MQSWINDNPRDEKTSEGSHKSLFGEFPRTPKFLFIHSLKAAEVEVDNSGINKHESATYGKLVTAYLYYVCDTHSNRAMKPLSGIRPHATPRKMPIACLAQ